MITVIIPVHNSEKYISKCIESVINQCNVTCELVLVDDHSEDNSFNICKQYSLRYNNIFVVKSYGHGVSSARNTGIELCRGDFIVFVDSDDILVENALFLLSNQINHCDFAMGTYYSVFQNGYKKLHNIDVFEGNLHDFLERIYYYIFHYILQGPCWKIFRKEIINQNKIRFPENMQYGEDAFFVYSYLEFCNTISVINVPLYYYIIHTVSLIHCFKKEKLTTNILLDDKIQKLCMFHGVVTERESNEYLMNCYSSLINEVSESHKILESTNIIKNAFFQDKIYQAYKNSDKMSLKKKIIYLFSKTRMFFILYIIGRLNSLLHKTILFDKKRR